MAGPEPPLPLPRGGPGSASLSPPRGDRTLLVRHLTAELTAEEKEDLLKYFGAQSVRVLSDKGRLKHTAFATFPNEKAALKALTRLHQLKLLGHTLVVEFAKEQDRVHSPVPLQIQRKRKGFEGSTCERNIDDCPNHKCQNGRDCVDGVNTYNCRCPPQWTGQFCTEDVDECLLQPNACQNRGICTNRNGGYGCVCVNSWSGDDCSENIDDCAFASRTPESTCIDRVASFSCLCPEGKAGLLCHLDDACISNPCHKGALCDTNPLNGQYICTCPQGYKGAYCTEDVDECAMANSNPCEHAGKCVNTDGAFHCECLKGYAGPRCEMDINKCHSDPCQNDATCLDKIGGFASLCMPGFKGVHCELEVNECQSNPCVNSGQCVDKVNRFQCLCPPGFMGPVCQIDIDDCSSTPCLNGAKCIDHPNGYECQCATGFTGVLCEENIDNCDLDPCHHGQCQVGIDSYTCICNPGYMGAICSDQIDVLKQPLLE